MSAFIPTLCFSHVLINIPLNSNSYVQSDSQQLPKQGPGGRYLPSNSGPSSGQATPVFGRLRNFDREEVLESALCWGSTWREHAQCFRESLSHEASPAPRVPCVVLGPKSH